MNGQLKWGLTFIFVLIFVSFNKKKTELGLIKFWSWSNNNYIGLCSVVCMTSILSFAKRKIIIIIINRISDWILNEPIFQSLFKLYYERSDGCKTTTKQNEPCWTLYMNIIYAYKYMRMNIMCERRVYIYFERIGEEVWLNNWQPESTVLNHIALSKIITNESQIFMGESD